MKKLLLLPLIITFFNVKAQTTAIPDANFEQALINLGLDVVLDGQVLTSNIDTVTELSISWSNISDLTGLEDFTALTFLRCSNNQLSSLNVTQNIDLIVLYCESNQISSLNVSQNIALIYLNCESNQLTSLDVSQNIALSYLYCRNNQINSLDVTQNLALTSLLCSYNQLTSLNVAQNTSLGIIYCNNNQLSCLNIKNGNNYNIFPLKAANNPNLTCLEVDDVAWSTINWTVANNSIDAQMSFSTNCPSSCAISIKENNLSNLSLYPNPTSKIITIDLGEVKTNIQATITNSIGQVILTQYLSSTSFINLDLESSSGIYFLQIEADGEIITKKIIKQ